MTIALAVFSFGAAAYAPSSVIGSRLRSLGWNATAGARRRPPSRNASSRRSIRSARRSRFRATIRFRTRAWLIQAGYREPRHVTMYVGSRVLFWRCWLSLGH